MYLYAYEQDEYVYARIHDPFGRGVGKKCLTAGGEMFLGDPIFWLTPCPIISEWPLTVL